MRETDFITILMARLLLPGRPHPNSVRRWMYDGCPDRSDPPQKVKLRSVKFGQKRLTKEIWIEEFIAKVTAAREPLTEHHEAEAKLDRLGVGNKNRPKKTSAKRAASRAR